MRTPEQGGERCTVWPFEAPRVVLPSHERDALLRLERDYGLSDFGRQQLDHHTRYADAVPHEPLNPRRWDGYDAGDCCAHPHGEAWRWWLCPIADVRGHVVLP